MEVKIEAGGDSMKSDGGQEETRWVIDGDKMESEFKMEKQSMEVEVNMEAGGDKMQSQTRKRPDGS